MPSQEPGIAVAHRLKELGKGADRRNEGWLFRVSRVSRRPRPLALVLRAVCRRCAGGCLVAGTMLAGARCAIAQSVHGSVVTASGEPISGVVLLLVDTMSNLTTRALTDSAGSYTVSARAPGVFVLRTLRIGFAPAASGPIPLRTGEQATRRIVLREIGIALDTVHVSDRTVCSLPAESASATFLLWDQVRAALTALEIGADDHTVFASTLTYDRNYGPDGTRLREQTVWPKSGAVSRPWYSASPQALHAQGYVATDPQTGDVTYRAPGIDALLSPEFATDHCFQLQGSEQSQRIGLRFEPNATRRSVAEIRGVLWVERDAHAISSLEYEYTNIPRPQAGHAGGSMTFGRFANGVPVVADWSVRMPVVTAGSGQTIVRGLDVTTDAPRVNSIAVRGGELVALRVRTDTVWRHAPAVINGMIVDAATERPVAGARVTLDSVNANALSGADGRFTLGGLLPGPHVLFVQTAALDSLGVGSRVSMMLVDAADSIVVRVPNPGEVRARGAEFAGVVTDDSTKRPISSADVTIPELRMQTRTDSTGAFRIEHVPGAQHRVVVRRIGYTPAEVAVRFTANRTVKRTIELHRTVMLDSVVVSATRNALPGFDEHRKVGLGQFLTRADVAKFDGRKLPGLLEQLRGLRLTYDASRYAAYVGTSRLGYVCKAQVYLDGLLIFRGGQSMQPPFDVNTIPPEQVEAVEWYASAGDVPAEYSNLDSVCGVLVIWTRRAR